MQMAWLIANAEAKNLGASEILPVHFLLATMKIIDPDFPGQLDKLDVSSEEWVAMCQEAECIRRYIEIRPDRVAERRRALRELLSKRKVRSPVKASGLLHRAKSTKRAFSDAAFFTDGDTVALRRLVQSFFEMQLLDLSLVDAK